MSKIREEIKEKLSRLTEGHHRVFKRMYWPEDLDANINDVVDAMQHDNLIWALEKVNRTFVNRVKKKLDQI